ncbi:MAG: ABC transporter permease subunit [Thermomicrobiales bacterium]|nr:ABC transporter permease subunit [Thermomicrobiales bacterium]
MAGISTVSSAPVNAQVATKKAFVESELQKTDWRHSAKFQSSLRTWLIRIIIWIVLIVVMFPVVYVVMTSFKGDGKGLNSQTLFPREYTLDLYRQLLRPGSNFLRWVQNSLIMGVTAGALQVIFSTFGGYAFSRMKFAGRKHGILFLLIIQMLPINMQAVAYYKMLGAVGLTNTRMGIILIFGLGGSALSVWLMKNFIDSIPRDLDEASYLDGGTQWTTFWRVIFPLVQPMLVAQFIFGFIGVYNEYVLTSILIFDDRLYPLGVGVRTFSTAVSTSWTLFCAAAVLGSVPILIIFFAAQRFLVEGLTRGAVKG